MRRWTTILYGASLLGAGYLLGSSGVLDLRTATAQDAGGEIPKETVDKVRAADRALGIAADALRTEGRYQTATEGVNAFLVLAGGGNAIEDLQSGTGVDPETFAGLYSGQARPEVADLLDRDGENRVTYNGEVVRMYSKARLQRLFAERTKLAESGL